MSAAKTDRDWEEKYRTGETPWDSSLPSQELISILQQFQPLPVRAIELGCGTGTNSVALAELGWQVTGVDCAVQALEVAQLKAERAKVHVQWINADVQNFGAGMPTFDFLFDRGCYHCCRRVDLVGYMQTVKNLTQPGSHMLCLCGNPNQQEPGGPPRVAEADLRNEFAPLFEILQLRPFQFEDAGGDQGPLGWSVWMQRTGLSVE